MKTLFLILLSLVYVLGDPNNRPIIGILTQPTTESLSSYGSSYIAASYVKYVEGGGGRVVPIFHNSTTEELTDLFWKINGVLFPGGGANLDSSTALYKSGSTLYQLALSAFDKGDSFPIFGHCMGFELLALITSRDQGILSGVDAENISLPLNFTSSAKNSKWFQGMPSNIWTILSTENVTMNNHVQSVSPTNFASLTPENEYLGDFYDILSTNFDRKGVEFISTWEGKKYPIFGMQWHAEKPQYEWDPQEVIPHTQNAIQANQYFAEFLVNQARNSLHHFPTEEEEYGALIYNYSPVYSQKATNSFEQAYVW